LVLCNVYPAPFVENIKSRQKVRDLCRHIKQPSKEVIRMTARDVLVNEPAISWLNEHCQAYIFWFNFYTLVVWALLMLEFFTKGEWATLPGGLMAIYLTFLTGFTGQKELVR